MGPDEIQRELSRDHLEWDELRERRVLGSVLAARSSRSLRARRVGVATVLVAAAAVVLFFVLRRSDKPIVASIVPPPSAQTEPARSSMKLPDGSVALLGRDAQAELGTVRADRLVILQSKGEVRYEVAHDPARVFVVQLGGVEVRALGTIFTTTLADRVGVHVDDGHVQVDDGNQSVILGPGEDLWVPIHVATPPPEAPPTPSARPTATEKPPIEILLANADHARETGKLPEAAKSLETLVADYPNDPQAVSALFTLGRVYRQSGRHRDAALAFRRCWQRGPRGSLAEDARAEEVASWNDAGDSAEAKRAAQAYLDRYPDGAYAKRMQGMIPSQ